MKIIKTNESIKYLEDNDTLIGEIDFPLTNEKENTITHTYVNPDYRGQGIAKKLLDDALSKIKEQGHLVKATCSYARKFIN